MANSLSISIKKASKRFLSDWIFRDLDLEISPNDKISILGSNGSGKSTLLQVIANYQLLTKGSISYCNIGLSDSKEISTNNVFERISVAAPYLELIEDYNITEAIEHQKIFKPFLKDLTTEQIIQISELEKSINKPIRLYSSGMKQRLKLTLAVLANSQLLLLDEPCSNLDKNAIDWYKHLISAYTNEKTIIVCSNSIENEFYFCSRQVNLEDYKFVLH